MSKAAAACAPAMRVLTLGLKGGRSVLRFAGFVTWGLHGLHNESLPNKGSSQHWKRDLFVSIFLGMTIHIVT